LVLAIIVTGSAFAIDTSIGFGGNFFWNSDPYAIETFMNTYGGGLFAFFDTTYIEASIGMVFGSIGEDGSAMAAYDGLTVSCLTFSLYFKYPLRLGFIGNVDIFPLIGIQYDFGIIGMDNFSDTIDLLNKLWIKFGMGADINLTDKMYLRPSAFWGLNFGSKTLSEFTPPRHGHDGLDIRLALGFRLSDKEPRETLASEEPEESWEPIPEREPRPGREPRPERVKAERDASNISVKFSVGGVIGIRSENYESYRYSLNVNEYYLWYSDSEATLSWFSPTFNARLLYSLDDGLRFGLGIDITAGFFGTVFYGHGPIETVIGDITTGTLAPYGIIGYNNINLHLGFDFVGFALYLCPNFVINDRIMIGFPVNLFGSNQNGIRSLFDPPKSKVSSPEPYSTVSYFEIGISIQYVF
jgi:hypothetical protein